MKKNIIFIGFFLFAIIIFISLISASTTITDLNINTTGNVTASNYCNSTDCYGISDFLTSGSGDNSSWNESYADTKYANISFNYNQTIPANTYTDSVNVTNFNWITSTFSTISTNYLSKWAAGNFVGSLYTTGADSSSSDSNALFQVIGSDGTPRFQIQNGGAEQASFVARSFMVVNQNNTRLNQSQNNLCSEWGFQHIDCNSSTTGADMGVQDDFETQGLLFATEGIYGDTTNWGMYMALGNLTDYDSGGSDGEFDDSEDLFCDHTSSPFTQAHVDGEYWVFIIQGDYQGAAAQIFSLINSSCVYVRHNPSWNIDISSQPFVIRNIPRFLVADGGFGTFYVGDDVESKFEIKVLNGTGSEGFKVNSIAGADQFDAASFYVDVNNNDGAVAIHSVVDSSVETDSTDSRNIFLEFIATNFDNSHHTFFTGDIIGTKTAGMTIDLFNLIGEYDAYINHGEPDTLTIAYYDNGAGTTTEVTTAFNSESTDISIFENDNSIIYFGTDVNFTQIAATLSAGSSRDIKPEYYYCNNAGVWTQAVGISDTTRGFRDSGSIDADNPPDRGTCNQEIDGTPFANTNNYTYVAIKRTENKALTVVENKFTISGSQINFILADDFIMLHGISSPPVTCDASHDGAIYYDSDIKFHCSCKAGTGWVQMNDYSTVCS